MPGTTARGEPPASSAYASTRRVFRIIDTVSRAGEQLTAKRLAHELGTSLSTCYQLLAILVEEGYVEKLPRHAGYRLGPTISLLHERGGRSPVTTTVEPVIRDLARRYDRHACFAVLTDGEVTVEHVEAPDHSPPIGVPRGFRGAAHALAVGKVLIAGTGLRGISDYIEHHRLEPFTRRTITDAGQLEAHLKKVRVTGVAVDLEEFAENMFDVAVPLEPEPGVVLGAIGMFTTARRSASESGPLIELARRGAQQAAELLRA